MKFKTGDKVIVISEVEPILEGSVGVVRSCYTDTGPYDYLIKFDGEGECLFYEHELEFAEIMKEVTIDEIDWI